MCVCVDVCVDECVSGLRDARAAATRRRQEKQRQISERCRGCVKVRGAHPIKAYFEMCNTARRMLRDMHVVDPELLDGSNFDGRTLQLEPFIDSPAAHDDGAALLLWDLSKLPREMALARCNIALEPYPRS